MKENRSPFGSSGHTGRQPFARRKLPEHDVAADFAYRLEVIEKLRSRGDKTPVILCTAMHRPNATLRALRFGVVDYLVKPVRPAEVRRIVGFVLEPGVDHFSRAMQAARSGDLAGAIQSLESIESLAPAELHWLRVLRLIRDRPSCDDEAGLDEQVRTSFPFLAFNAMDSH